MARIISSKYSTAEASVSELSSDWKPNNTKKSKKNKKREEKKLKKTIKSGNKKNLRPDESSATTSAQNQESDALIQQHSPESDNVFYYEDGETSSLNDELIDDDEKSFKRGNRFKPASMEEVLEGKNKQIMELRIEVDFLRDQIVNLKIRNKRLCNIMGYGDSKIASLEEVEKLREDNNDLSDKVAALNIQLEELQFKKGGNFKNKPKK